MLTVHTSCVSILLSRKFEANMLNIGGCWIRRMSINWFGAIKLGYTEHSFVRGWRYRLCYAATEQKKSRSQTENKASCLPTTCKPQRRVRRNKTIHPGHVRRNVGINLGTGIFSYGNIQEDADGSTVSLTNSQDIPIENKAIKLILADILVNGFFLLQIIIIILPFENPLLVDHHFGKTSQNCLYLFYTASQLLKKNNGCILQHFPYAPTKLFPK